MYDTINFKHTSKCIKPSVLIIFIAVLVCYQSIEIIIEYSLFNDLIYRDYLKNKILANIDDCRYQNTLPKSIWMIFYC